MANQSLPVMILDLARHAILQEKEKHAMFIFYLYFCYNDFKHGFVIVFYLFQCQTKFKLFKQKYQYVKLVFH